MSNEDPDSGQNPDLASTHFVHSCLGSTTTEVGLPATHEIDSDMAIASLSE